MPYEVKARMTNPAYVLPGAGAAIQSLMEAAKQGGVPESTLELVHLRASQINSCSACVYASVAGGKKAGDTDERLHNVAAWREAPFYTDAERAALALAEAATRLQDGAPGVTDEIWEEVNAHFTEEQIGAINLEIALTNFFNRINRTTREQAGKTW